MQQAFQPSMRYSNAVLITTKTVQVFVKLDYLGAFL